MPDETNCMTNSKEDLDAIADILEKREGIRFSWTDGGGTLFEVYMIPSKLIKHWVISQGSEQYGRYHENVIVGIHRLGCFHVNILGARTNPFSEGYVVEKFGLDKGETAKAFADLLNGICARLNPLHERNLLV